MKNKIDAITRGSLIFLMGLLVFCVVWQVFSRYILNIPSTFTDELARFLLIWVSLLGIAYLSGQNRHIAIDVLSQKLSSPARIRLGVFINILIILFVFSVLVVGGGRLVYTTFTYMQLTPTLQLPMAVIYLVAPLSGLLVVYYRIYDIQMILTSGGERPAAESFPADDPSHD